MFRIEDRERATNSLMAHLALNGVTPDRVDGLRELVAYVVESLEEYHDQGTAGSMVESVALLYGDMVKAGLGDNVAPFDIYNMAWELTDPEEN
jgi:hypothetical protein